MKPNCDKYCPDFSEHGICGIAQRGICEDPEYDNVVYENLSKICVTLITPDGKATMVTLR